MCDCAWSELPEGETPINLNYYYTYYQGYVVDKFDIEPVENPVAIWIGEKTEDGFIDWSTCYEATSEITYLPAVSNTWILPNLLWKVGDALPTSYADPDGQFTAEIQWYDENTSLQEGVKFDSTSSYHVEVQITPGEGYGKIQEYTMFYFGSLSVVSYYNKNSPMNFDLGKAYVTDQYEIMAVLYNDIFNLAGKFDDKWKQTTCDSEGFSTYLYVGDSIETNHKSATEINASAEGVKEGDLTVAINFESLNEGKVLKTSYTVTNTGGEQKKFSLGSSADVQIGASDDAIVTPFTDGSGFSMVSTRRVDKDATGMAAQLNFWCQNAKGVTDVDHFWYGAYGDSAKGNGYCGEASTFLSWNDNKTKCIFTALPENRLSAADESKWTPGEELDSAMAWSWTDREIGADETQTYSVLFAIGGAGSENLVSGDFTNITEKEGTITYSGDLEFDVTSITVDGTEIPSDAYIVNSQEKTITFKTSAGLDEGKTVVVTLGETPVNVRNNINNALTHTWTYYVDGADASTIIATRDDGKTVSLTLSATSPTYSGSAISKDTLFSGMDFSAFNTATGQTLSTSDIKLYASTDTSKTNELSQIEAAGNYVADLTVEGATATCNVTVSSTPTQGGGGNSNPSTPGGGDSKPSTPTENYTIPVKNENTVKVEAEIKDGKANVSEITVDTIDKVVNNKNAESKVDTITIDLSGAKQEVTGVTLSKKSVETLAETTADKDNGIETATIELSKATVVLDNKTLETLVDQAKGSQIELVVADTKQNNLNTAQQTTLKDYQVATTFEAYFSSNGQRIHDFNGGKAIVSVDFKPETGKSTSYYHMVYVADDGKISRYKTKYESGRLMFTTTHFSDYAVIYDTSEKNATEEPPKEEESGTDTNVTLDTTYRKLCLRVPTSTKTTNVLKWNKVSDADGYVIYGAPCNTKTKAYTMEKQVTIKNGSTTTWTDKSLTSGTYYKYYIKAYKLVDGKKVWLAKSKVVHSTTTGGEYGNAKSVKVNKTSVSLAVGKTFTIKAEQVVKDQPIKKHTEIKFESSNSKIASVTSKGVIKAKSKGTCYIYVYAQNGMYKRIKVTVK